MTRETDTETAEAHELTAGGLAVVAAVEQAAPKAKRTTRAGTRKAAGAKRTTKRSGTTKRAGTKGRKGAGK
jgi:hypothetical protein